MSIFYGMSAMDVRNKFSCHLFHVLCGEYSRNQCDPMGTGIEYGEGILFFDPADGENRHLGLLDRFFEKVESERGAVLHF